MSFLLLLAILAVLGGIVLVAAGRTSGLADADPDRAPLGVLPPEDVGPPDVDRLRFSLAFRGYRMDEVDDVLDRLRTELAERDARIAELQGDAGTAHTASGPAEAGAPSPDTGAEVDDDVLVDHQESGSGPGGGRVAAGQPGHGSSTPGADPDASPRASPRED